MSGEGSEVNERNKESEYPAISKRILEEVRKNKKNILSQECYDESLVKRFQEDSDSEIADYLETQLDYMRTAKDIVDAFRVFTHGRNKITKEEVQKILRKANPDFNPDDIIGDMSEFKQEGSIDIDQMVVDLMYGTGDKSKDAVPEPNSSSDVGQSGMNGTAAGSG